MKKIFFMLLAIIFTGIVINGCKHDPDPIVIPPGSSGNVGTAVCFQSDILPLLQTNCGKSNCHDAATHQGDYIFDSYNNIIKKGVVPGNATGSKIYKVLFASGSDKMPPAPNLDLTAAQKALIGKWINEGAKNTINCSLPCDTTQFKYAANVTPILTNYCTGCHSGGAPSGNIDLTIYGNVRNLGINGRLVGAITHAAGYSAMPKDAGKLSDCQIRQIQKWVAAGALNN
jgi:hypothetical protein